jgi:hypothetical protein
MVMAKKRDPAEVVDTIRESIEVSKRGSRKVRAYRFRELFGYQAWSAPRREHVEKLLSEAGIVVQPPLVEAGRDDWLLMSMPTLPEVREEHREPRPSDAWFTHLEEVRLNTEREVEMHFAAPLFRELGYRQEQEAAGFGFTMWEGVSHRRAEADLLYFADETHDLEDGQPLVLVECKTPGKKPGGGAGQARSYAYWVKPAYYLITDGDSLTVWNYQGGAVPDVRVIEVRRTDLRDRFDDLYSVLNPEASAAARQEKIDRLTPK